LTIALGGAGDDTIFGGMHNTSTLYSLVTNNGNDTLEGGDGNDFLYNAGGSASIGGGGDNDTIFAGFGDDILDGGTGADYMESADGSDVFFVDSALDQVVNDGAGTDIVMSTINFDLTTDVQGTDDIENLTLLGTAATGTGTSEANTIVGNDVANSLYGGGGVDRIEGGKGNDLVQGGGGDDALFGGATIDTAVFNGSFADATLSAGANYTAIVTNATGGQDTLTGFELLAFGDEIIDLRSFASTASVTAQGTRAEGRTLTAEFTNVDGTIDQTTVAYQWTRDGTAIAGATSASFILTQADVGTDVQIVTSFNNIFGFGEGLTSAPSTLIANVNDVPTGVVVITGTATEDQILTADASAVADTDGLGAFSYQCCAAASGLRVQKR
jgi:Ca2+-binding RTX toxin-like protein